MMADRLLRGFVLGLAVLMVACSRPAGPTEEPAADSPAAKPEAAQTQAAAPAAPPEAEAPAPAPVEAPAAPGEPAPSTAETTAAPQPAPVERRQPAPAPTTAAAPAAAPEPEPAPAPAPAPEPEVAATPEPEPAPAPVQAPAAAPAAGPAVVDKGGLIAVAATKPGLKLVGSESCEMCHEVQYNSWADTAHAKRTPPLDCEGCHGPGSEYKKMSVMQDPAKARAAGLVIPGLDFCRQCHVKGATEALLTQAHAHDE